MRCATRVKQVTLGGVTYRPVDVLAGTIDAGKRFLVQQTQKAVFLCRAFHQGHHQLLMVSRDVCCFEVWCDLKLTRRHFIVVRLGGNPQLV